MTTRREGAATIHGERAYYVALPFIRTDDGELAAAEAQERQTAGAAVREAERMAITAPGAVAFSRTGDPASGEFEDALVIKRFGATTAEDRINAQTSEPFRVNAYLCDEPQYAIEFALRISQGVQDVMAKDIVGRAAGADICGKYIGFASIQEQRTVVKDGITYRLTQLRFREDNRTAGTAKQQK